MHVEDLMFSLLAIYIRIKVLPNDWRKKPNAVVMCSMYGMNFVEKKWNFETSDFMRGNLKGFVVFFFFFEEQINEGIFL